MTQKKRNTITDTKSHFSICSCSSKLYQKAETFYCVICTATVVLYRPVHADILHRAKDWLGTIHNRH